MDITLTQSIATAPERTAVREQVRSTRRDPGFVRAIAQLVFVLAAEVTLVVMLVVL